MTDFIGICRCSSYLDRQILTVQYQDLVPKLRLLLVLVPQAYFLSTLRYLLILPLETRRPSLEGTGVNQESMGAEQGIWLKERSQKLSVIPHPSGWVSFLKRVLSWRAVCSKNSV